MGLHPPRTAGEFFEKAAGLAPVYQALETAILERWPETNVRVQKSQISFDSKRPFAAAWIPPRKGLWGRPGPFLALSLYFHAPLEHPRVAARVEPYPGRWTHHLNLSSAEEVDGELLEWLSWARAWRDGIWGQPLFELSRVRWFSFPGFFEIKETGEGKPAETGSRHGSDPTTKAGWPSPEQFPSFAGSCSAALRPAELHR